MRGRVATVVFLALLVAGRVPAGQPTARFPFRDSRLSIDERVRDLLGRMTLEEKFWQLFMIPGDLDDTSHDYSHGVFGLQISMTPERAAAQSQDRDGAAAVARAHADRINAIQRYFVEQTRLGIPIIPFDEAVHGLARDGATMFPQAIALAATWNPELVSRVSSAIARETRTRGIRQVLSPVVNIADDVRWGRVEETYGEDPWLASEMTRAFVRPVEQAGIVTTPKHFVANVGEGGRDSYPIEYSERRLEERDFPPFEAALRDAHARSIMTAYNSVDGAPATQNERLLTGVLKRAWRFAGFVISDAAATGGATVLHMTEPNTPAAAAHAWQAGLDVVFQSSFDQYRPYWEAVRRGLVTQSIIDAAVARVLRVKFQLGLFEEPYVRAEDAGVWNGHADHLALAREAARAALVLLKNDRHRLPLPKTVHSVAVIGTDAAEARLGGYSARGVGPVSIVDAIRQKLGPSAVVRYAPGPGRTTREFVVIPSERLIPSSGEGGAHGLTGEYYGNNRLDGRPAIVRTDPQVDFRWTLNSPARGISFDWYSVRWTGSVTAPPEGARRVAVEASDGYRLFVDGSLAIDDWKKQSYGTRAVDVAFAPGSAHQIRLEYFESTGSARVKLMWDAGLVDDAQSRIDEATAIVRQSDAAVMVAGLEEGEFRDRALLSLPGHQEDAILSAAATGKPIVVVLIGGSAITMSRWIDRVDAILDAWYPGEQGGAAVADVLFGDDNPAGRLPITFPMAEGQLPLYYNHKPTGRGDDYVDLTGQPLFPFGFGLSYTTFEYSALRIAPQGIAASGRARVRCTVKNTGARPGDEVVQMYVRDELASMARPVMELRGFKRIHLDAGGQADVEFELGPEHLRMLDRHMRWIVEPGAFRIMIGASSKDIRLRGELTVR